MPLLYAIGCGENIYIVYWAEYIGNCYKSKGKVPIGKYLKNPSIRENTNDQ